MSHNKLRATLIGFSAVIMVSTLGVLTAASGNVPPFLLNGLCFTISGLVSLVYLRLKLGSFKVIFPPPKVLAFGTAGLFGTHFFYFTSLRNAPPVDANLINYTWPLLVVLFSNLLPEEKLRWFHLFGAVLGLTGVSMLLSGGFSFSFEGKHAVGYGAAVVTALIWSGYSVLSRRFSKIPTRAVSLFCLFTGILSFVCHFMFETTVWPLSRTEWWSVLGLAAFPVGLAFFAWDHGVKNGDIQVLGATSYAAPLLSTMFLIMFGFGSLNLTIGTACVLITAGALFAAKDVIFVKIYMRDRKLKFSSGTCCNSYQLMKQHRDCPKI